MGADLALWMFPALMFMIFLGFPVAFALLSVAFVFGAIRFNFSLGAVNVFAQKIDEVASAYVIGAVPLFVFMGALLERSGIAERLFEAIHLWTRRLPGGLAVGTVILCVIFAAASGVVGATESVVGLLAIPVMLRYSYEKGLISGTICAGGSLGTIIPPSVLVVILGPVADVDVGALFMGMLFPGLILAGLYILYILVRCIIRPQDGQRLPPDENDPPFLTKLWVTSVALVPPLVLIFAVLGTIMLGWATPTEAAAMGAAGSVIMTMIYRNFSLGVLKESLIKTLLVTAMILTILLAGNVFATVFTIAGGLVTTQNLVEGAGLSGWSTMAILLGLAFLAGFVLDLISIILIIIPIAMPIITQFEFYDLDQGQIRNWFCILFLIVIQTSYLTPPMAPAIFYLRGISPPEITLMHMYKGVLPFIFLEIIALAMVAAWPELALWLPEKMFAMRDF
jgi:tripartite ATP-independent transporter DctM subunit